MRSKMPISKTKENIPEQTSRKYSHYILYRPTQIKFLMKWETCVYSKVTLEFVNSIFVRPACIFYF